MLSTEETRQLERLALGGSAGTPSAAAAGPRVARVRGAGSEFHDFRHYQPGDDPRSIEWTIYGRLGQLVTRTSRADAHLRVHLLVDISRSMSLGTPDKLSCARRLAALLAYVAVREQHAVGLTTFDDRVRHHMTPVVGRPRLVQVLRALDESSASGPSSIGQALTDYGTIERGPGLVVVISDCFDRAGLFQGLRHLLLRGLTPALVQVLSPEDVEPPITGDAEIIDAEDASARPLQVDAATVSAYARALAELRTSLGEFCATHGLPWIEVQSSHSFVQLLHAFERAGVLTARS